MFGKQATEANTGGTAKFIINLLIFFPPRNKKMILSFAIFEEYHFSEDFPLL